MGAGCSSATIGRVDRSGLVKGEAPLEPEFELPSNSGVANFDSHSSEAQIHRISDPADAGVTLRFLSQFLLQVHDQRFSDYPDFTIGDLVQQEILPSTAGLSCSYAELSAVPRQFVRPPTRFISHAWSRPFRCLVNNLMSLECNQGSDAVTLDGRSMDGRMRLGETTNLGWMDVSVWIDIFALNQHVSERDQDDLFVVRSAVYRSEKVLLSLDQTGEALTRSWCIFEVWTAAQVAYEKNSESLVELLLPSRPDWPRLRAAVELIDVERCRASEPKDADLILEVFSLAASGERGGRIGTGKEAFSEVHRLLRQTLFERTPQLLDEKLVKGWDVEMLSDPEVLLERGDELVRQKRFDAAETVYRRLVVVREAAQEPDDDSLASSLLLLGRVLAQQGKWQECELRLRRCLSVMETMYGKRDVGLLDTLLVLAEALSNLKKFHEADSLYKRALELVNSVDGIDSVVAATVLEKMGSVQRDLGNLLPAQDLLEKALETRERVQGTTHQDLRPVLTALADVLMDKGYDEEAEAACLRSLAIAESALGPNDVSLVEDLSKLGQMMSAKGDVPAAEKLLRRALNIQEKVEGRDHATVARSLAQLAGALAGAGDDARRQQAQELYRRAVAIYEKSPNEHHVALAATLNSFGGFLESQGMAEQAEPMYWRSLEIHEDELGPDHLEVASDCTKLGELMRGMGRLEDAEDMLLRALRIDETHLGPHHQRVAEDLDRLGKILQGLDRLSEAEEMYKKALTVGDASLTANHKDTIRRSQVLASVQVDMGKHKDAARNLEAAARALGVLFGVNHEHALSASSLSAVTLEAAGLLQPAIATWRKIRQSEVEPFFTNAKDHILALERKLVNMGTGSGRTLLKPIDSTADEGECITDNIEEEAEPDPDEPEPQPEEDKEQDAPAQESEFMRKLREQREATDKLIASSLAKAAASAPPSTPTLERVEHDEDGAPLTEMPSSLPDTDNVQKEATASGQKDNCNADETSLGGARNATPPFEDRANTSDIDEVPKDPNLNTIQIEGAISAIQKSAVPQAVDQSEGVFVGHDLENDEDQPITPTRNGVDTNVGFVEDRPAYPGQEVMDVAQESGVHHLLSPPNASEDEDDMTQLSPQ